MSCLILQRVSEKVGGAEGTKLDEDFMEMEKVSFLQLERCDSHSRDEHLVGCLLEVSNFGRCN